jgi:hypothetical protein
MKIRFLADRVSFYIKRKLLTVSVQRLLLMFLSLSYRVMYHFKVF